VDCGVPDSRFFISVDVGAVEIELTPDDRREIDTAASTITVQGARYPDNLEQMTGR